MRISYLYTATDKLNCKLGQKKYVLYSFFYFAYEQYHSYLKKILAKCGSLNLFFGEAYIKFREKPLKEYHNVNLFYHKMS